VSVAVVGKYVELPDSYISVKEALNHAALQHGRKLQVSWVHAEEVDRHGPEALLRSAQGIVVPGGFGSRGVEGMVKAARYAREKKVPYLGLCLGMQVMVIEFARTIFGETANSTEFDKGTKYPVISMLAEQRKVVDMGGTMRLGVYPCRPVPGTMAESAYGRDEVMERHRHRYEFNNEFREVLSGAGLVPSGLSPDGKLVEISERRDHPFMLGTQFHPEFRSRPQRPHPLFSAFMGAAKETLQEGAQLPLEKAS